MVRRHPRNIFFQGNHFLFLGGVKEQEILEHLFIAPEFSIDPKLQLPAKGLEKGFVFFSVLFKQIRQFALDLALNVFGNQLQLAVMLEHFPGNVQGQVVRFHHALDEAEIIRQELGAFIHDENAAGIQLQALFVFLGIEVIRDGFRNIQDGIVTDHAFGAGVNIL